MRFGIETQATSPSAGLPRCAMLWASYLQTVYANKISATTARGVCDLQNLDALRGEENCNEPRDQREADQDGVAITELLTDIAVDHQADNLTHHCAIAETSLPRRGDLICAVWQLLAVFALELRHGV